MLRKELGVLCCLWLLACLGVGCGSTPVPAQFHPQVIIQTDKFQFQAGVTNYTSTLTYSWQNTGDASSIDQGSTITSGSASVTIKDSAGTEVYSADLVPNGSFASQLGTSGEWTVVVKLTRSRGR
ncbi:MAG TPA: hypothetical protein VLL05_10710 [Terriglobales bacterium]|nr:hypothetical protein [Terriglobales bacterium]